VNVVQVTLPYRGPSHPGQIITKAKNCTSVFQSLLKSKQRHISNGKKASRCDTAFQFSLKGCPQRLGLA